MKTSRFFYHLPGELIARYPLPRGSSRLLVVNRTSGRIEHRRFHDILSCLLPGDVLVLNDTRVVRARLLGRKETGGAAEVFLLRELAPARWRCLVRASKKARPGMRVMFNDNHWACIEERVGDEYVVRLSDPGLAETQGVVPLPPYLEREAEDADIETYQTVYARHDGSVAAPTAGLHFTDAMLDAVAAMGVRLAFVTLHVGAGTFQPVREKRVEDHVMHAEDYAVSDQAARIIGEAMDRGSRIVAVGTTAARLLEHHMGTFGRIMPGRGSTDIFIHNGHPFRAVGALITNFHLPCSTLLMLVSAFAGHDLIMKAYQEAISERYRFYSYGDAMFIM